MLARVETGVRARHGAVLVGGALLEMRDIDPATVQAWLSENTLASHLPSDFVCERSDPLFPARVPLQADGVGLVGWLLLGPRPDGTLYGKEERAALSEIADPIARALALAIERQHLDAVRWEREIKLDRQVDALTRRVDVLSSFLRERHGFEADATSDSTTLA